VEASPTMRHEQREGAVQHPSESATNRDNNSFSDFQLLDSHRYDKPSNQATIIEDPVEENNVTRIHFKHPSFKKRIL
jgi:hypothetical protein